MVGRFSLCRFISRIVWVCYCFSIYMRTNVELIYMKKAIQGIVFGLIVCAMVFGSATPVRAAGLTAAQTAAILGLLSSFGADSATVQAVAADLGGSVLLQPAAPTLLCALQGGNLSRGLSDRDTNGQITILQSYLGITPTGYFGPLTLAKVKVLQAAHGISTTGIVGPLTRALILGQLCGGFVPTPSTTGYTFGTPFMVNLGQTAIESSQGQLSVAPVAISDGSVQVVLGENCPRGTACLYYPTKTVSMSLNQAVTFQSYTVTLTAVGGSSATFVATKSASTTSAIVVTAPAAGSTFARGGEMPIAWLADRSVPASASVMLSLYTQAGQNLGPIAVVQSTAGSYSWHIPAYPQNYMCTMIYPNGLCGTDIPAGQYIIKVTASADPFNPFAASYGAGQSGLFTISLP